MVLIWIETSDFHGILQQFYNPAVLWLIQDHSHLASPRTTIFMKSLSATRITSNCTWAFIHSATWSCGHGVILLRKTVKLCFSRQLTFKFAALIQLLTSPTSFKLQPFGAMPFSLSLEKTTFWPTVLTFSETSMDQSTIIWLERMACFCHTHWNWPVASTSDIHKRESSPCRKKLSLDIAQLLFSLVTNMALNNSYKSERILKWLMEFFGWIKELFEEKLWRTFIENFGVNFQLKINVF